MITSNLLELAEKSIDHLEILSSDELNRYENMSSEKRKQEFLAGRYALKTNLLKHRFSTEKTYNDISIDYGSLGYPMLREGDFEIGLSHSRNYVFSVIYSRENIVGVDIETIRSDIFLEKLLTDSEKELFIDSDVTSKMAYILFSCKEALGKALKIGLLADYSIYEVKKVENMTILNNQVFQLSFKRFPFLTAYSFEKEEGEICSFVVQRGIEAEKILQELL
ncbi:4'-phosphopantetheinyl transferase superfamily protein [Listeria monocytogenes]|uniref:4'-phosphopantetheinyl transferase family protein n=1 Tax=Listeria monocytogenes TaxID=1639 RepID=UPI0010E385B2|nr:4'-phosphopantetheinyl transferase superfamily protein [Listeria monocytogenes]EAD7632587.1 4'-phosphopantetheinyl transferase superfamily protein [Listeria monocytogenes]